MIGDGGAVEVREGGPEDVDAVARLEREVVGAPRWGREVYARMIEGGGGGVRRRLLVAVSGETLVGFAVASVAGAGEERWGELESVAVAQQWRGARVGGRLCAEVTAWCAAEGARWVELEVRAGSLVAQRLYQVLGFVEVGRRRGYYSRPVEDAVLMRAELDVPR